MKRTDFSAGYRNKRTTFVGAALGAVLYGQQVGFALPQTPEQWMGFVIALLTALGFLFAKDATRIRVRKKTPALTNVKRALSYVSATVAAFVILSSCQVFRAGQGDAVRTATSAGRIACAVVTSEGGVAEIQATHTALDAIESAFDRGADVRPQLVLFPRRVQGYVALVFAETADRTTADFHAAVQAFVAGCRQTLVPIGDATSWRT